MNYITDLSPCAYFCDSEKLIAVGWLEKGKPYRTGNVDEAFFARLIELLIGPWQPGVFGGFHSCDFCRFSAAPPGVHYEGQFVSTGHANLFVPGEGVLYAAPSMIAHYIVAHEYAPPELFCEAVMRCPPMHSMDYLKALLKSSPTEFKRLFLPTERGA
jgi:hypothetical protein